MNNPNDDELWDMCSKLECILCKYHFPVSYWNFNIRLSDGWKKL